MAGTERAPSKIIKAAVGLGLLLIAAFLYWIFFLDPALDDIARAQEKQVQLDRDIQRLNNKVAQGPAVEQEWRELKEDIEQMQLLVPDLDILPQVLGSLEQLLAAAGVSIDALRAGEVSFLGQHAAITFDMRVSGRDSALLNLLRELEGFVHRIVIEQASWTRNDPESQLNLRFNLVLLPEG